MIEQQLLPPPVRSETSPLAKTFDRLASITEYAAPFGPAILGQPQGTDWIRAATFFDQPFIDDFAGRVQSEYQTRSRTFVAGKLLGAYQWGMLVTAIGAFLADQRVPRLDAGELVLHWNADEGYVDAIATRSWHFTALRDDGAADDPHASTVADVGALRDHLRETIEGHLATPVALLARRFGIRPRALWPVVADRCASTIIRLGGKLLASGEEAWSLRHEVATLVNAPGSALDNKATGVLTVSDGDHIHLYLRRATCCQAYRLPEHGYCDTCPHFTVEERLALLRADR